MLRTPACVVAVVALAVGSLAMRNDPAFDATNLGLAEADAEANVEKDQASQDLAQTGNANYGQRRRQGTTTTTTATTTSVDTTTMTTATTTTVAPATCATTPFDCSGHANTTQNKGFGVSCSGDTTTCDAATCCASTATCGTTPFNCSGEANNTQNKGSDASCSGNASACDAATCCEAPTAAPSEAGETLADWSQKMRARKLRFMKAKAGKGQKVGLTSREAAKTAAEAAKQEGATPAEVMTAAGEAAGKAADDEGAAPGDAVNAATEAAAKVAAEEGMSPEEAAKAAAAAAKEDGASPQDIIEVAGEAAGKAAAEEGASDDEIAKAGGEAAGEAATEQGSSSADAAKDAAEAARKAGASPAQVAEAVRDASGKVATEEGLHSAEAGEVAEEEAKIKELKEELNSETAKNTALEAEEGASTEQELVARSDMTCVKKHVLIVVDMQNDYDIPSSKAIHHGAVKNPYAGDMTMEISAVEKVMGTGTFDQVVFTGDWLVQEILDEYGLGPEKAFCLRKEDDPDAEGAQPIESLMAACKRAGHAEPIFFTKNQNDAFNEIAPNPSLKGKTVKGGAYPDRGYDLKGDWGGKMLKEVLADQGFFPGDTVLTFVGTAADMCVMTTSIHSRALGFEAQALRPAIYGDVGKDAAWNLSDASPQLADTDPTWMEKVYSSQVSVGRDRAFGYMELAGVSVVDTLEACTKAAETPSSRGLDLSSTKSAMGEAEGAFSHAAAAFSRAADAFSGKPTPTKSVAEETTEAKDEATAAGERSANVVQLTEEAEKKDAGVAAARKAEDEAHAWTLKEEKIAKEAWDNAAKTGQAQVKKHEQDVAQAKTEADAKRAAEAQAKEAAAKEAAEVAEALKQRQAAAAAAQEAAPKAESKTLDASLDGKPGKGGGAKAAPDQNKNVDTAAAGQGASQSQAQGPSVDAAAAGKGSSAAPAKGQSVDTTAQAGAGAAAAAGSGWSFGMEKIRTAVHWPSTGLGVIIGVSLVGCILGCYFHCR